MHFDCDDTSDSYKKLQDQVCTKLAHVLTSLDHSLLLSSELSVDLGSSAIDTQLAINGVLDWAVPHESCMCVTSLSE